jgi:hypothetical protein
MFEPRKPNQSSKNSFRAEPAPAKKPKKKSQPFKLPALNIEFGLVKKVSSVLDGSILTSDFIVKSVPFFIYLFLLAMLYIGNNYIAQSKVKKIDAYGKELKDLHDQQISLKSDLMSLTRRSEVAKRLEIRAVKEATQPPFKIYVLKNEEDN